MSSPGTDTLARHPLTAVLVVAVLVALALHLGIPGPPVPPPPVEVDLPGVTADGVGRAVAVSGRARGVARVPPALHVAVGRCEATCRFPRPEPGEPGPLAAVGEGDEVATEGTVGAVGTGYVHLDGRKLPSARKP